jgi:hypothetical protein
VTLLALHRLPVRLAPLGAALGIVVAIGFAFRPRAPLRPPAAAVAPAAPARARLHLYRDAGGRAVRLADGALARPGDLVQASIVPAGRAHAVVLSLDGRGRVTLHYPDAPAGSTRLEPGAELPLAHAFELDDAPAFERFFLVTAARPLDPARLLDVARELASDPRGARTAPLPLARGQEQHALLLRKASP